MSTNKELTEQHRKVLAENLDILESKYHQKKPDLDPQREARKYNEEQCHHIKQGNIDAAYAAACKEEAFLDLIAETEAADKKNPNFKLPIFCECCAGLLREQPKKPNYIRGLCGRYHTQGCAAQKDGKNRLALEMLLKIKTLEPWIQ